MKQKLKSIVETLILCARKGLALRGHRDYCKHIEEGPHAKLRALL